MTDEDVYLTNIERKSTSLMLEWYSRLDFQLLPKNDL
jgi:hypothetical protein